MKRGCILVLTILLAGFGAWADDRHHAAEVTPDARFEFLKQLEGTWAGDGIDGEPGGVYEFRVTAGGTAVREIEMVGTPMEMVTLYYMEGKNLVATHYCMLGNQPRLMAAKRVVDDTLAFACAGTPGNARSHDEHHVHGWTMRLAGDGKLHYSAELTQDGKVTEAPVSILTRRQQTAAVAGP